MIEAVVEAIFFLAGTPTPNIFIIGGFGLLVLAMLGKVGGEFVVENKRAAFFLGAFFMALGLGVHVLPIFLRASGTSADPSPPSGIAAGASEVTSDPDDAPSMIAPASAQPEDERIAAPDCWPGAISTYPGFIEEQSNVPPADSTTIQGDVPGGEIHAITAGTARVKDVSLPGGRDRGSVIILLPGETYTVEGLNPTHNWHGRFNLAPDDWEALANVLAAQQMKPGTCSDGDGCSTVDVLAVGPEGVTQFVESVPPVDDWDGCLP